MSYTRPLASAADATWQGSAAYTRLLASAADASFFVGNLASGFVATQLGVPDIPLLANSVGAVTQLGVPASALVQHADPIFSTVFGSPAVAPSAIGFLATNFGTSSIPLVADGIVSTVALGVPASQISYPASGFSTTALGTPQNIPNAVGFGSTSFGAPSGYQFWRAVALAPVTRFSPAYFAFAQTQIASGFTRSSFGIPLGVRFTTSPVNLLCQAFGLTSAFVSTPTSGSLQFGGAIGFTGTQLPVPNAASGQSAAALVSTYFGTPGISVTAHSTSLAQTHIGVPSLLLTQMASSIQGTRFGFPASSRSRTYTAYGFYEGGRVGQPVGFVRINRTATGFCSSASGTPAASFRNRTASLAPGTYFGQALLVRAPTC